jgi:hypothetical protein
MEGYVFEAYEYNCRSATGYANDKGIINIDVIG